MKRIFRKLIYDIYCFIKRQINYYEKVRLMERQMLKVGTKSYGHFDLIINSYDGSEQPINIGNYTSIAPDVRIITGGIHPIYWVSLFPFRIKYSLSGALIDGTPKTKGPVNIGSDVWIGTGVTILSGVTISDGAVIYSNALVNKDVPPYAIVSGIPGKVIGYRFSSDIIVELEKIKWWNWNEQDIINAVPLLSSNQLNEFIKRYKK